MLSLTSFLREICTNVAAQEQRYTKYEVRSSVRIKAADYNVEVEVKRRESFLNDTRGWKFLRSSELISHPEISAHCEMYILNDFPYDIVEMQRDGKE